MRRNRVRSYTIDAENEEEFNKQCDSFLKHLEYNNKNNEEIKELTEENNINYDDFGEINSEDDFGDENDSFDSLNKIEDKNIDQDEKNIELLCIYLKQSIALQAKNNNNNGNDNIFYRYKNPLHILSGNAIYDLNIKELVDDIMTENELGNKNEINDDCEKNNSLKDFISQNIKGDCTLKIMFMSNNDSTLNSYVNNFFSIENKKEKNKDIDNIDFEIRKKQIRLFNKNISLQIFDTSNKFHNNLSSKIYYQFSNAFFIFIEATNHNVQKYMEDIFIKLDKYLFEKTIVIFGVNMLFEQDCSIDGFNLKEFASNKNCLYIPIKINDFTMKNHIILNILNLILIKKIDNKKESTRKYSKDDKKIGNMKKDLTNKINDLSYKNMNNYIYDITKMDIPNSIGYKKDYRIYHLNAFDTEKKNIFSKKKSRKWSDN